MKLKTKLKKWFTYRYVSFYGAMLAVLIFTASIYLQLKIGLHPCSLCIIQRFIVAFLALLFISGIFHTPLPFWRRIYCSSILLVSIAGIATAARQVWLQHLPADQVPACTPGLGYLLNYVPFVDAMKIVFLGSGDCAKVDWTLFTLSIAEWTLGFFVIFAIIAIIQIVRK